MSATERPSAPGQPSSPIPADAAWKAWAHLLPGWWQGLEAGLSLQQQCLQRWNLRQQEGWRHWQHAGAPTFWMDMTLASMRWSLQEWDQALQDAMAAPVLLHGQCPDQAAPWLGLCRLWTELPLQAWAQSWAAAGRERPR